MSDNEWINALNKQLHMISTVNVNYNIYFCGYAKHSVMYVINVKQRDTAQKNTGKTATTVSTGIDVCFSWYKVIFTYIMF